MAQVFLGLQAEVPPQRERIIAALERLGSCGVRILRTSSWFCDAPRGDPRGTIGSALEAHTILVPGWLYPICQGIERAPGREPGDRPIEVTYPHLLRRGALLASPVELVPGMVHPVLGRTVAERFTELPPERRPRRSGETTSS